MKKVMLIIGLIAFTGLNLQAQNTLEVRGQIKSELTNLPLKDCHVYVSENVGTISDADGYFTLKLSPEYAESSFMITHMGYKDLKQPVKEAGNFLDLRMKEEIIILEEVVVTADPWIEFRDVISALKQVYGDDAELSNAIVEELDKMDVDIRKKVVRYQDNK